MSCEFVIIPQRDGTAKRLPIPIEITNAEDRASAIVAYVNDPPQAALDAAESVPFVAPQVPEVPTPKTAKADKER